MSHWDKDEEKKWPVDPSSVDTDSDWTTTESDFTTDTEAEQGSEGSGFVSGLRKKVKRRNKSAKELEREAWMPSKKEITAEAQALGIDRKELRRYYQSCGYGDLDYEKATDYRCIPIWRPEMYFSQKSAKDARKYEMYHYLADDPTVIDHRVRFQDDFYDILMEWIDVDRTMNVREFTGLYRQRDEDSMSGNVFAQYDFDEAYKVQLDWLAYRNLTTKVGRRADSATRRFLWGVGSTEFNHSSQVDTSDEALNERAPNRGIPKHPEGQTFHMGLSENPHHMRVDDKTRKAMKKQTNWIDPEGHRKDWFFRMLDGGNIQSDAEQKYETFRKGVPNENASEEEMRTYVQQQIWDDRKRFIEWKKLRTQGYSHENPYYRSTPKGDTPDAGSEGWWSGGRGYKLPHQSLHGGVDSFQPWENDDESHDGRSASDQNRMDDELDLPICSYHFKATMSPANWFVLKKNFRASMVPGTQNWNENAYRNWFERETIMKMPLGMKKWFVRREEDLMTCHWFRTKIMEHAGEQEHWRMGELRWNRRNLRPYLRVGMYVMAPLVSTYVTYTVRGLAPNTTPEKAENNKYEYERWKAMCLTNEYDETYTGCYGQHLIGMVDQPSSSFRRAPKFEDLSDKERRNARTQFRQIFAYDDLHSDFYCEELAGDDGPLTDYLLNRKKKG